MTSPIEELASEPLADWEQELLASTEEKQPMTVDELWFSLAISQVERANYVTADAAVDWYMMDDDHYDERACTDGYQAESQAHYDMWAQQNKVEKAWGARNTWFQVSMQHMEERCQQQN